MVKHSNSDDAQQNSFAARWAKWVIRWRWPVLAFSLLLAMGLGYGGQFLGFNNDYHVFFSEDNPQLQAFDDLQGKYTQDDNVFIVIEPKDGTVFTRETLSALESLTEASWQTPYSSRVDAITNFQHTRAVEDDLYVDDLVEDAANKTEEELAYIKEVALKEPLLVHRLISKKGDVTAVNITVKLPGEDVNEANEIIAYVREMIADFEAENPNLKTYQSGMIMLSGAFFEASQKDMGTLMPLMFLVIVLTIFLATRSLSSTFSALIVIIMSIMAAMGAAGWLGIQLTPPSAAAPTIIMTLAIADSIHVLITLIQQMRLGLPKKVAIVESVRLNFMPVFITSLTTVIGFLTMNLSDAPPFHDLGNMTAIGMTAAFVFSITTLPALMAILPVRVKVNQAAANGNATASSWLERLGNFIVLHNRRLLWGTTAAIVGISLLVVKNEMNDEFVNYFDESIQFRSDTDFISDRLTGIYNVEYSIGAGENGGVNNPEYLAKLAEFEAWLYDQEEVIHVNSYVEVAKRVNKSMHGDSLQYYTVPTNREEAAQYLLLYEMSLPFGLDLNNQINVDKSETRLTATVENLSSTELIDFTRRSEQWLQNNTPEYMHTFGTSTTLMFSFLGRRQFQSMITATALAILLISIVLIFALKSFRFGLMSLIPNLTPILVGFGVWALLSGVINTGIAIVFGMTLGIIVDDTVHFISKYIRARGDLGKSPEEAVRYAFSTVGRALVVTTVVLVAGFAILAQSSFGMNSGMAKVTVVIITLALIIDFLILPGLLIIMGEQQEKRLAKARTAVLK